MMTNDETNCETVVVRIPFSELVLAAGMSPLTDGELRELRLIPLGHSKPDMTLDHLRTIRHRVATDEIMRQVRAEAGCTNSQDLIHIDEEIENPDLIAEWFRRLADAKKIAVRQVRPLEEVVTEFNLPLKCFVPSFSGQVSPGPGRSGMSGLSRYLDAYSAKPVKYKLVSGPVDEHAKSFLIRGIYLTPPTPRDCGFVIA